MIGMDQVLSRVDRLPSSAAILGRLHALLHDPRSGADDFAQLIEQDAALAAALLRTANSAFFGLRTQVKVVRQAVTLLGLRRVIDVAASSWLQKQLSAPLPGYGMDAHGFWLHCVGTAILAERMAEATAAPSSEVYTAGLLHDIGKLALAAYVAERSEEIAQAMKSSRTTFDDAELAVMGLDHAQLGGRLAELWSLPPETIAAARWHHKPSGVPAEHRVVVDLVHAANVFAHVLGLGSDAGGLSRVMDRNATSRIGLRPRQMDHIAAAALDDIRELGAVMAPGGSS